MSYQTCAFDHAKTCGYDCPMYRGDGCMVRETCNNADSIRVSLERIEYVLSSIHRTLTHLADLRTPATFV